VLAIKRGEGDFHREKLRGARTARTVVQGLVGEEEREGGKAGWQPLAPFKGTF